MKFLEQISTEDLEQLGTIETFQLQRQALIEVIEKLDADFKQSHETLRSEQKISEPSYYKERLQTLAKEKDSLLSSIISLDNEIMQYIDKLRKETIQRLQAVQSGHKTISAYRSPMDNLSNRKTKLDSEA